MLVNSSRWELQGVRWTLLALLLSWLVGHPTDSKWSLPFILGPLHWSAISPFRFREIYIMSWCPICHCRRCPPLYWCHFFFSISFQLLKLNLLCFAALLYWCTNFSLAPTPSTHPAGQTTCDLQFLTFFFFKMNLFWGRFGKEGCKPHPLPPRL